MRGPPPGGLSVGTILLSVVISGTTQPVYGNDGQEPARVLWLIKGLGPGGAERLLVLNARFRRREQVSYEVAYLLGWKDALVGDLAAEGVSSTCLGARNSMDPRWVWRLRKHLGAHPVDVVHAHSPLAAIGARLVLRTLRRCRRPLLLTTEHNVWESHTRITSRANALSAFLDDRRVAVSGAVRASLPRRYQADTEVVRYGVDVAGLRAQAGDRSAMRQELGLGDEVLVIGTVANLRVTKGYPDLLAAARLLLDRRPGVRFVSVGQGPLEAELIALRDELGLVDKFQFLGHREDAPRILSALDVFCMASHHEGLPVAMMEALVLGLPVVATSVGGVPELVTDGQEALLVPPRRPDLLADALEFLVDHPDRRLEMSANATATADGLSVVRAVRRTEEIYREMLDHREMLDQ